MILVLLIFKDLALFLLRFLMGVIFIFRGWPKLKSFKAAGILEFILGILLILGIFTQAAALILALEMLAAVIWKIIKGHKSFGGYELELLLVAANLILATMGGGLLAFIF